MDARLCVRSRHLRPHLVIKVSMQIIYSFLVVFRTGVHQRSQQMPHVIAFISRSVSCQLLDALELLRRRHLRHGCLDRACTVLDPLLVKHGGVRVLVVRFTSDEFAEGHLELREPFEHGLLEAQMASVQEEGD